MNKEYILYNLKEALKQLSETVNEMENDPGYEYGDYVVDTTHLYHHINTAWNAKNSSELESEECSDKNFKEWRRFPKDIDMIAE